MPVCASCSAVLAGRSLMAFSQQSVGWLVLSLLLLVAFVAFVMYWKINHWAFAALGEALQEKGWKFLGLREKRCPKLREVDLQLRQLARSAPFNRAFDSQRPALPYYLLLNASSHGCSSLLDALSCSWERSEEFYAPQSEAPAGSYRALRWWRNQDALFVAPCTIHPFETSESSDCAAVIRRIIQHRRQRPIDALVLYISARELDPAHEQLLIQRAEQLRKLVLLCQQVGSTAPPIQLFIGEIDHLEGFDAFARSLPKEEGERTWGSYVEAPAPGLTWATQGGKALERLHGALHLRCQQASLHEERPQDWSSIYRFTQRIQKLQAPLELFLRALFPSSPDPCSLRQVLLVGSRASTCSFAANILPQGRLRDLHRPEQSLRARRSQAQWGRVGLTLGALVGLLVWSLPYLSARENREIQASFRALILSANAERTAEDLRESLRASARLHRKLDRLHDTPGLRYGLGMNQSQILLGPARAHFVRLVNQGPLAPFFRKSREQIQSLLREQKALSHSQLLELRAALTPYLLLTKGKTPRALPDTSTYTQALQKILLQRLSDDGSTKDRIESRRIAEQYLRAIAIDPSLRIAQIDELARNAQTRLYDKASLQTRVRELVSTFQDKGISIDPRSIVAAPKAGATANTIAFGYTRDGYQEFLKPALKNLATTLAQESWLQSKARSEADWERILSQVYLEQYQSRWESFVKSIRFNLEEASKALALEHDRRALRFQQTYESLANTLQYNTQYKPLSGQAQGLSEMAMHFLPLIRFAQPQKRDPSAQKSDLERYLDLLRVLDRSSHDDAHREIRELRAQAQALSQLQGAPWNKWFAQRLVAPFDHHGRALVRVQQDDSQASWCSLAKRLRREIFQHYPFRAQASKGSDLEALTELLHPSQGLLWRKVDDQLGTWVARRGSRFVAAPGAKAILQPRILVFLNAAWRLSRTLFPGQSASPSLELEIEAKPQSRVHRTRFEWGHQRYNYSNGPEHAKKLRWPSASKQPTALFEARHSQGSIHRFFQGPWSLFQLLESGQPRREAKGSFFSLRWRSSGHRGPEVSLRLRPISSKGAWGKAKAGSFMQLFRQRAFIHPPMQLFRHSPACSEPSTHSLSTKRK